MIGSEAAVASVAWKARSSSSRRDVLATGTTNMVRVLFEHSRRALDQP
jgi:hypothetical protein